MEVRTALLERGLAKRSVSTYQAELVRIELWAASQGWTLATVPGEPLAAYVTTRPKTWATRKMIRNALVHYWSIVDRSDPPLWAVRAPRKPKGMCRAIEESEASLLAKAARARGDREGLAVLFGLYAALRREEIANVRWGDIKDGWLYVMGKGDKPAKVPLHAVLIEVLAETEHTSEWLFPGRFPGQPVNPTTVWTWALKVSEEALGARVSTHVLRHTCLATANDNTGDLRAVQEFARHSRPETTAIYTRASVRRLKAAVASLDY